MITSRSPDRPTRAAARHAADIEARGWETRLWHSIAHQKRVGKKPLPPARAPRHPPVEST